MSEVDKKDSETYINNEAQSAEKSSPDPLEDLSSKFTVAFNLDNEKEFEVATWIVNSCEKSGLSRNEFLKQQLLAVKAGKGSTPTLKEASETLLRVCDPSVRHAVEEAAKDWLNIPIWQLICGRLAMSFDQGELHSIIHLPEWGEDGFEEPTQAECTLCGFSFWPERRGQIAPSHECVTWFKHRERGLTATKKCPYRNPPQEKEEVVDGPRAGTRPDSTSEFADDLATVGEGSSPENAEGETVN